MRKITQADWVAVERYVREHGERCAISIEQLMDARTRMARGDWLTTLPADAHVLLTHMLCGGWLDFVTEAFAGQPMNTLAVMIHVPQLWDGGRFPRHDPWLAVWWPQDGPLVQVPGIEAVSLALTIGAEMGVQRDSFGRAVVFDGQGGQNFFGTLTVRPAARAEEKGGE